MEETAAAAATAPAGVVVPPGAPLPRGGAAEVWLRGPRSVVELGDAVSRLRALHPPPAISVDAADRAGVEAALGLGALPVLGPAPLRDLVSLAAAAAPGGAAVLLPVSVGRTDAEAHARLHSDRWLHELHAEGAVLVGTLEACQDAVIELGHAGAADLRLRPAVTADLPDVLAQLTVLGRSPLDLLRPGIPRSPAPPAPAEWGGRPGPHDADSTPGHRDSAGTP